MISTDPFDAHAGPPHPDFSAGPVDTAAAAGDNSADRLALCTPAQLLTVTVQHYPTVGISVVIADGELDTLTAPLLERCVSEQLLAAPTHLILDLESVRFLGASALSCLLRARELVQQTPASQLHLAGLITRRVARALQVSGLLGRFNTYPTLIHAMVAVLADQPTITGSDTVVPAPVLAAVWCCSVGSTWTLELHEVHQNMQLGPIVDWISSGVPLTQPKPDTQTYDLLATHGLWLFADPSPHPHGNSRHRIGYVCADPELINLADLVRDQAVKTDLHPVQLAASWTAAGFSAQAATAWIRAGCYTPK
jgi:anti-anti-sigma factor